MKVKSILLNALAIIVLTACGSEQPDSNNNAETSNNIESNSDSDETPSNSSSLSNSTIESENEDGIDMDGSSSENEMAEQTTENNTGVTPVKTEEMLPETTKPLSEANTESIPMIDLDKKNSNYDFHAYKDLTSFLRKHVTSAGKVNYGSIKSDLKSLNSIIEEFESNPIQSSWSRNQKMCFWINVYNIYTIKLVADNYPTSSIKNINGGKPWDKKFIKLGGKTYTLNNVENDILRKQYFDARIHFALNCASKSCPILLNKAYTPGSLSSLLTAQTKKFLNDTSKNSFSKKEAQISKLFKWYKGDFTKNGTVMDFIKKYHSLDYTPKKITYKDYSWDLNK